jgi:AcrR family transcriptional regulator
MSEVSSLRRAPRQERSQKRVDEILQAATALLFEVGYEGMTTSLIAERAGFPVGSLYQFFANKDAVLHALAQRYLDDLQALNRRMFSPDSIYVPMPVLFARSVDMLAEYTIAHPGSHHIFASPWVSSELVEVSQAMTNDITRQIEWILAAKTPGLPPARRALCAQTLMQIIKSLLQGIETAASDQRPLLIEEFKRLGIAYLEDIQRRQE